MKTQRQNLEFLLLFLLLGILTAGFSVNPLSSTSTSQLNTTATPAPDLMTITGRVIPASGGLVPDGTEVNLVAYLGLQTVIDDIAPVQEDGSYWFENVPLNEEWIYLVGVRYKSVDFYSELLYGSKEYAGQNTALPIIVYESTTDVSLLEAERVQVHLDFPTDDTISVTQSYMISNPSNMVIVPKEFGEPVLEFPLPQGAETLDFKSGELGGRFVLTENGFGDRQIVTTGQTQHQLMYSYTLPYRKGAMLDFKMPVPANSFLLQMPINGVNLKSNLLTDNGERDIQGRFMHLFTANDVPAGESVSVILSGKLRETESVNSNSDNLALGIALFLIAGLVVVSRVSQQKKDREEAEEPAVKSLPISEPGYTEEELLEAIASLDDLYKTGAFSEEDYCARRKSLKGRLREVREAE